ncbi:MAG: TolC family protein, partial [Candidatus Cloacimonadaceae bacterium]|nr:TolC family protein [Candidatus Cloacimonadaceae bacterium]
EKGNLNLGILESSVDLSRRAYSISKSAFLPTLMLTASRQYRENGIDRYEFNSSDQIMLNLSIPLLPQYTNYASTRTAFYNYRVTELRAKTASDGIKMGVESAVLNLIGSAKQVQASALALEYTRQSYEQMQERFRQNMLSSSDMIDIELMLSAARTASVNAFFSYLQSKTTLLNLMGSVDEQLLINISQLSMEE